MKRSKRERFLLGLLMLVSIWALALKCFILPGQGRLAEAREHLRTVKEEQSKAELYLKHYPDLRERLEELKEEEGGEFFYRDIDDVFMDRNIQELAGRAGVGIVRLDIGTPVPAQGWDTGIWRARAMYPEQALKRMGMPWKLPPVWGTQRT